MAKAPGIPAAPTDIMSSSLREDEIFASTPHGLKEMHPALLDSLRDTLNQNNQALLQQKNGVGRETVKRYRLDQPLKKTAALNGNDLRSLNFTLNGLIERNTGSPAPSEDTVRKIQRATGFVDTQALGLTGADIAAIKKFDNGTIKLAASALAPQKTPNPNLAATQNKALRKAGLLGSQNHPGLLDKLKTLDPAKVENTLLDIQAGHVIDGVYGSRTQNALTIMVNKEGSMAFYAAKPDIPHAPLMSGASNIVAAGFHDAGLGQVPVSLARVKPVASGAVGVTGAAAALGARRDMMTPANNLQYSILKPSTVASDPQIGSPPAQMDAGAPAPAVQQPTVEQLQKKAAEWKAAETTGTRGTMPRPRPPMKPGVAKGTDLLVKHTTSGLSSSPT